MGTRGAGAGATDRIALPLTARGEPFGSLELALGPSGRRYSAGDRAFAELVAGRVAVVLDNAGLTRQAREAEQRLVAALDTLGEAVTMNGPDGRTVYANEAAVVLLKADSVEELTSSEVGEISARFLLLDEHGTPVELEEFPAFKALRGEDRPPPLLLRNIVRATGEERWLRQQGERAAHARRRHRPRGQRDRGRLGGQGRRARAGAAGRRDARAVGVRRPRGGAPARRRARRRPRGGLVRDRPARRPRDPPGRARAAGRPARPTRRAGS